MCIKTNLSWFENVFSLFFQYLSKIPECWKSGTPMIRCEMNEQEQRVEIIIDESKKKQEAELSYEEGTREDPRNNNMSLGVLFLEKNIRDM